MQRKFLNLLTLNTSIMKTIKIETVIKITFITLVISTIIYNLLTVGLYDF